MQGSITPDDPLGIPFRALVEQSLVGLYIVQDDVFQYVNPRFAEMLGLTQEEMAGKPVENVIAPETLATVRENLQKRLSGEVPSIFYHSRGVHKDGRRIDVDVHGTRIPYRGRPAVIGVAIDVTEARQREQEIAFSRQRLQELSQHLLTVREEQRTKISREIHDVLGGTLTALKMDIGWLKKQAVEPRIATRVDTMMELIREAIDTARRISADLRPGVLDNLGLFDAIEWEAERFRERMDIACNINMGKAPGKIADEAAIAIFRIFQEALTNISRHAEASRVDIDADCADGMLTISVRDNGKGIASETAGDIKSYGLVGMAERARQLGAKLEITNAAGGGTLVVLRCPIAAEGSQA